MKLTAVQKSAILTALEKGVKNEKEACRADADAEIRDLYETTGADRMKVKIGDTEIATFSLTFSKDEYEVTDAEAFHDFLLAQGLAEVKQTIKPAYMHQAVKLMQESCPEGIDEAVSVSKDAPKLMKRVGDAFVLEGTTEVIPGVVPAPSVIKNTRMTGCKPEVVLPALNALPGGVGGFLMGGEQ